MFALYAGPSVAICNVLHFFQTVVLMRITSPFVWRLKYSIYLSICVALFKTKLHSATHEHPKKGNWNIKLYLRNVMLSSLLDVD